MNVRWDCRSVFRSGILAGLLLASTCAAEPLDIVFGGDFDTSQPLQWVRRHPKAGGSSIALGHAYVTATRFAGASSEFLTLYLQVPPALKGNADYPQWSALKTFGDATGSVPAIGDCVYAEGTISQFHGATQLAEAVWMATPGACGNEGIVPYVPASVTAVATDTDPVPDNGNQPGANAESLESVLVKLNSVTVQTGGTGAFKIGDMVSGPYLSVTGFLYQYTAVQGATVASITGVLDQFDVTMPSAQKVYQLLPRSAGDIVDN